MEPKVSVVVPIYNVEAYLPRCLNSLRRQTLSDIEIILVDDGSPDRCGEIADRYARGDGRFLVIHQANAGLSAARNRGIELASAPYLMFVDSDDWVEPDFCRIPFEAAKEHGADMVMFRYWRDGFGKKSAKCISLLEGMISKGDAIKLLYCGIGELAWNKLYHRKLFDGVRYPEGYVYEDVGTTYQLVHKAEKIWSTNTALYHYCFRADSITGSKTIDSRRKFYEMRKRAALGLKDYGYSKLGEELLADTCLSYLVFFGTNQEQSKDCLRVLRDKRQHLVNETWKRKGMMLILRLSPRLFDLICILSGKRRWKRT